MKRVLIGIVIIFASCGLLWAQEKPELSLQRGHSGQADILATALSKDLRYAYTADNEGSVKVWNADTGQVLRTIYDADAYPDEEDLGKTLSSVFSPTADWVATWDGKGVVRRFALPDGKIIDSFPVEEMKGDGWDPEGFLLTDGRSLYLFNRTRMEKRALDGTLNLQREIPEIFDVSLHYVSLSSDGRVLAVGHEGRLSLYQTTDLELLESKTVQEPLRAVAVSPESDRVAYTTQEEVVLLQIPGLSDKGRIPFDDSWADRGLLWYQGDVYLYTYQWSGKELLARADFAASKLDILEEDAYAVSASVTPDSRMFFGRFGGDSWIYDPSTKERRAFASDIGGFSSFDLHPTSGDLFTGSRQGEVARWSHQNGRVERRYEGLDAWISSVKVSPDGKRLMAADYSSGRVVCWDIDSGATLSTLDLNRGKFADGVVWARWVDSDHYVYSAPRKPLTLVDAVTGQETISWEVEKARPLRADVRNGRLVAGYDGNRLLETSVGGTRDTLIKQLPYGRTCRVAALTYGATNQTVFCLDHRGHLFRWNTSDPAGEPEEIGEIEGHVLDMDFHEGALRIWRRDGKILTVNPEGKVLTSMQLADDNVWGAKIVADGTIVAIADYYKLGFYDAETGLRRGRLVGVRDNSGWVALEASGSFDGNDVGLSTIQFSLDGELYGVDQFLTQYLRPGILAELLPGGKKSLRTAAPLTSSTVKKPPSVRILEPASGAQVSGEKVQVRIEVGARGSGASPPLVYHNGHKLPEAGLQKIDDSHFQYEVELVQGLNEIQATAFDSSNQVESRRDRIRVTAPDVKDRAPKLHLLSVGIDSYGSGLKLEFAGEDAQSISELFQSDLYSTGTRTLLKNEEATQQGIKEAIARLAAVAEPQDAFVLYLAGHGTVVNDTYYFLPQDVQTGSDQELEKTALSADLLGTMLASVPATKQLLVLDTCRAGKLVEDGKIYSRPGLEEVRSHNLLSRTSGTFLIAATKDKDYAFEIPQLGHGILTYSVLETLGAKDGKGESAVTANELLRAVSQKVPELSQKYNGTRQMVVQYSSGQDFPLTK